MTDRIMVVEDDRAHRRTLERHLGQSGYEVLALESGEQALASVASFEPTLVITDIRLPGLDGFDVLDRLHECLPDVDVILITAYDDAQVAIDAMKRGAFDYLVKPLDLDRFDDVVSECFRERALAHESSSWQAEDEIAPAAEWIPVGRDPKMRDIYKLVGTVAGSRTPVLIAGETGTGKELIAHTIHNNGPAPDEPFVAVNCAAIPETLLESELFGHVRGSFTGAIGDRKGRFELAGTGTIFLDEICDTSMAFQAKLLRVLQEREFYPVGGELPRRTRARVIAATNRDLEELIEKGTFREDLYFRLRVIEVRIPPLRERRGDIPALVHHILEKVSREIGHRVPVVPDEVMAELVAFDWPGNVRELENAVTRAALMARGGTLVADHLGLGSVAETFRESEDGLSLDAVERYHVQRVLAETAGNKSETARLLKISRPRLDRMIDRFDLVV